MEQRIDEFIDYLNTEDYAANTLAAYRSDLSQLSKYLQGLGLTRWDQVKTKDLLNYILHLKEREYALSTVARKIASARSFFDFLSDIGILKDNPAPAISVPSVKQLPSGEALSQEDVTKLLAIVEEDQSPKGLRDRVLFGLLVEAGLRPSEVVSMNVEDVDWTKLTPTLREAMRRYLEEGRPRWALGEEERALFLSMGVGVGGGRLTRQGVWLIVTKRGRAASLGDLSPRKLRRAHAQLKSPEGGPAEVPQRGGS